jgi:GPH family glycoside/pentoside/hexuronide:cation symporter
VTLAAAPARTAGLPGYALFAGLLAMAGLPIYIHAPKFYVDNFGVSLGALGLALVLLRGIDFVQDPALGWLAETTRRHRALGVTIAAGVMALAMLGLFAVAPPTAPLIWFAITLTALFSAYSFLTIAFYSQGVAKAAAMGADGHVRLATWRETGALIGVCLASVAPTVLAMGFDAPFALFAVLFAGLCGAAVLGMRGEWQAAPVATETGFRVVLADRTARRLLVIAFLNAAPVAVTSSLFLYFVESRLQAPGWEGPFLLLFFVAAAGAAPLWGRAAERHGAKRVLLAGMALAIAAFVFSALLGPGDLLPFALVCLASGAALGADLTLLAAIFARRMEKVSPDASRAFGLWAFTTKATLAVSAGVVLPLLGASGFVSGSGVANTPEALAMLTFLYALLPCALKLAALGLLAATRLEES